MEKEEKLDFIHHFTSAELEELRHGVAGEEDGIMVIDAALINGQIALVLSADYRNDECVVTVASPNLTHDVYACRMTTTNPVRELERFLFFVEAVARVIHFQTEEAAIILAALTDKAILRSGRVGGEA